jgi:hypothetical protein
MILQGDGTAGTGIPHALQWRSDRAGAQLQRHPTTGPNGTYFNPTTEFTASFNSFDGNGVALTGDDWGAGTSIHDNSFTNSSFGHVGYGVLDAVEDVGAYFGPNNDFDATGGRPIGIFGYTAGQEITAHRLCRLHRRHDGGRRSTLHAEGGDDYIDAGSGDDTLDGCTGDDILVGGSGTDTAFYADPITVANLRRSPTPTPRPAGNQPGWTVTTATEGTDQLTGVEIIDSAAGRILLVGSGGFATIQAADRRRAGRRLPSSSPPAPMSSSHHRNGFTAYIFCRSRRDGHRARRLRVARGQRRQRDLRHRVRAVIAVNDSTGVDISDIQVDGSFAGDSTPGQQRRRADRNRLFQFVGRDLERRPSTMSATARVAACSVSSTARPVHRRRHHAWPGSVGHRHHDHRFPEDPARSSPESRSISPATRSPASAGPASPPRTASRSSTPEGVVDGNTISGFGYTAPFYAPRESSPSSRPVRSRSPTM